MGYHVGHDIIMSSTCCTKTTCQHEKSNEKTRMDEAKSPVLDYKFSKPSEICLTSPVKAQTNCLLRSKLLFNFITHSDANLRSSTLSSPPPLVLPFHHISHSRPCT
eukprot:749300-Hanusia_phi.AAC.8